MNEWEKHQGTRKHKNRIRKARLPIQEAQKKEKEKIIYEGNDEVGKGLFGGDEEYWVIIIK